MRWSLSRYFLAVSSASTLVILLLATIKRPGDPPPMEFKSFTPGSTKNPRRSVAINSVFPFSRKRPGKKAEEGGRKGEKRSNYFPLAYPPHRRFIIYLDKKFARGDSVRERKKEKKKHRFRKIRTRWRTRKNEGTARSTGFHLSVVFLFSCSSFRNTGRPIFTFRLNFVFSKSKFGASPGPR